MKPRHIVFYKSPLKNKKYRVVFKYDGESWYVDFGDIRYEHFKDRTPLKLYSYLDHGDPERRRNYLSRSSGIKSAGKATNNDPMSANYWSNKYLW